MSEPFTETAPIEVDFVADLACPWCFLGLVRLDRARAMRPDWPVRVRWRPFFLNPHMPPEGMDRATYVRRKFGGNAKDVYQRIEASGRADGVAFAFDRMPRTPNTTLAQRLILFAEEQGLADAVIRALFRALFQEGRDVGRPEVLAAVAEEGFRLLSDVLEETHDSQGDALPRLARMGVAYVAFAQRYPGYFRIMFRPELAELKHSDDPEHPTNCAFAQLVDTIVE